MTRHPMLHHLAAAALAILLAGCSSMGGEQEATRFYTLAPAADLQPLSTTGPSQIIGVGPVYLPDYLARPQIVTFTSAYEMSLSEFNRWGGALDSEMIGVLTQNLVRLLPGHRVVSLPVRVTANPDLQVVVQVLAFERTASGTVDLVAGWGLLADSGRKAQALRETTIRVTPADASYEATVAAMSEALNTLSLEIADEIAGTAM